MTNLEIVFAEADWVTPSHLCGIRLRRDAPVDLIAESRKAVEWKRASLAEQEGGFDVVATSGDLEVHTSWRRLGPGLVSRHDSLISHAAKPITIRRCHSLVRLPSGKWNLEWQSSAWTMENQPEQGPLNGATVKLQHRPGRTTEQATPFAVLSNSKGDRLSIHVAPASNWTIRATPNEAGNESPNISVAAGAEDDGFSWVLNPGETLSMPEILYGNDDPSALHAAWVQRSPSRGVPVMYNTWYDRFENLDVENLRHQLAAAVEIGCEAFVVDAGWFGDGQGWWDQVGNWSERKVGSFSGHMREFADEVRKTGLGFGLWMEPERFGRQANVRSEHPEWFPDGDQPFTRIDLAQRGAYDRLLAEMCRLVDTYELAWMKIDFNFEFGPDLTGHAHTEYFHAWHRLVAELQKKYPNTIFEACSSGAMRLDLKVLEQFRVGYLSDNVNPWDNISLAAGAWRRLPPGRIGRWCVLRQRSGDIQTCTGAGWENAQICSTEFAVAVAFMGALGFSGDLASLPKEELAKLKKAVRAYKVCRPRIAHALGYLLTPQKRLGDREGHTVVQFHHGDWNLLGIYRLTRASGEVTVKPVQIQPEKTYLVRDLLGGPSQRLTGVKLLNEGLTVKLEPPNSAALIEISEAE